MIAFSSSVGQTITVRNVEVLVGLLLLALATALLAARLRVPYTLALVLVGLLLGFLHVLPPLRLDPDLVLFVFMPALLFEGAWSSDVAVLAANWLPVLLLAAPGLLVSLGIVALALHAGGALPWLVALLIGAIVSPTDPVAVIGLLRQLSMPARLRSIIEGESLFNDGLGAVVFTVVLGVLLQTRGADGPWSGLSGGLIALRVLWLILGGPALGLAGGWLVAHWLRHVDDHLVETAATFGAAYGIYLIGDQLATSGLLAVVCAGLVLGSYGRRIGMSGRTREAVDNVWEFVGYVANSLLFLLVGLQLGGASLAAATLPILWAVGGALVGRVVMVYSSAWLYNALARHVARRVSPSAPPSGWAVPLPVRWRPLIVFSGLRGALSLALVLSLPLTSAQAAPLERIVYGVVLVTLVGQGACMRLLLLRYQATRAAHAQQST